MLSNLSAILTSSSLVQIFKRDNQSSFGDESGADETNLLNIRSKANFEISDVDLCLFAFDVNKADVAH